MDFSEIGVEPDLIDALREQGITEPFEVQVEAIPFALQGADVCCRAPTGSGKTLAFGLPLLSRCEKASPYLPKALILTPTRELAEQICNVLKPLASKLRLRVLAVYGGTTYNKQRRALEKGVEILVACPGRLLDLMDQNSLGLGDVDIVVIDEADRMADMGFIKPVCKILDKCSENRQTILFSATLDDEVAELVSRYQAYPVNVEVGPKAVSMDSMNHFFWELKSSRKSEISSKAIMRMGKSIIFCRTRAGVDRVGYELQDLGIKATSLHGGLTQSQRDKAMKRFIKGNCIALVATDVAARGIDIDGIQCVIHYDPPENGKAYKHRSGRTARAGEHGTVISLIQKPQKKSCVKLQKEVGIRFEITPPKVGILPETDFYYEEYLAETKEARESDKPSKNKSRRSRSYHNKRNRRYRKSNQGRKQSSNRNGFSRRNRNSNKNETQNTHNKNRSRSRGRRNYRRSNSKNKQRQRN